MPRKPKLNPGEEMEMDLAEEYVNLVDQLLEEFAPVRPWWTAELSPDAKLYRYLEVRPKLLPWLVEAGVWLGLTTFDDLLAHLDDIWFGPKLMDMAPPEFIVTLPVDLAEFVQANPADAADHIRTMERMLANRLVKLRSLPVVEETLPTAAY